MKGATQCAKKVKQVFKSLRSSLGKVNRPQPGDPIMQLILGIFSRDAQEARAREALDRFHQMVVDYNELRVIPPSELALAVEDFPDPRTKCEDLSRALNRIFAIEHVVSLERIAGGAKADAANYLAGIPGLEAYTRARIRLLGFGHHAIPLDEAMWAYARAHDLVAADCSLEEAQSFLERQVTAEDALEFIALLRKQAWSEFSSAVRKGDVERIRSVPPDRTTRNMLQLIASGAAALPETDEEFVPEGFEEAPEEAPAIEPDSALDENGAAKPAKKSKKKPPKAAAAGPKPKAKAAAKGKGKRSAKASTRAQSA